MIQLKEKIQIFGLGEISAYLTIQDFLMLPLTYTLPIFTFDTEILDKLEDKKDARVEFIHQCISQVKNQLQKNGSDIKVFYGKPKDILSQIIENWDISAVYTNRDYEPYAKKRDGELESLLSKKGIGFYTFKDQVIFEKDEILTDGGDRYKVFTSYKNKWIKKLESGKLQALPDLS